MSSSSVLQYNTPSFAIHLISLAIHLHFPCNTIPSTIHLSCNTISVLQYNFFFSATAHFCNTILPYCNTLTQPTCKPHCNTIPCIAIQFSSPTSLVAIQILVLQYNYLTNKPPLAIQFSKPTTLPRLQYNFPIAIHLRSTTLPQSLSHNTKLSITIQFRQWPKIVSALPFFFHYYYYYFFTLISSYWKIPKKIYILIFFFIFPNTQINS